MLYISTEDFIIKGDYEELIDDGAPSMGTYTVERTVLIPKHTGLELDENGYVKHIYKEINLGVSMYAGTFKTRENLKELIDVKLKQIDEAEYERIVEIGEQRKEVLDELEYNWHKSDCISDYVDDICTDKKHISATEYENLSRQMMQNATEYIRLLAALTMLKTQIG